MGDRNGAAGSEAACDGAGAGTALTSTAGGVLWGATGETTGETKGSMTGAAFIGVALLSCAAEVAASAAAGTGVIPTGDCSGNVLTNGGVTSTAAASGAASSGVVATDAAEGSDAKGVPHLGQKRALGLHRFWQCSQVLPAESAAGAGDAAGSGTGACLAPQFLQNLALGARGFPHCEQFIVCNGLVMLRAMRSLLIADWRVLGIHCTKD